MNQSIKQSVSFKTPGDGRARGAPARDEGGVTLSDLGHSSTTARRIATQREEGQLNNTCGEAGPGVRAASVFDPPAIIGDQPGTQMSAGTLKKEAHQEVGRMLNLQLADEYMLYKITRDYHWNVTGPDYFSLRLLFQIQHDESAVWVDELAERIRQLHLVKRLGWAELMASARCSAVPGFELAARYMLAELLEVHDQIIVRLEADCRICLLCYRDAATAAFLAGLKEQHENAAWMLRAQLETADIKTAEPSLAFF